VVCRGEPRRLGTEGGLNPDGLRRPGPGAYREPADGPRLPDPLRVKPAAAVRSPRAAGARQSGPPGGRSPQISHRGHHTQPVCPVVRIARPRDATERRKPRDQAADWREAQQAQRSAKPNRTDSGQRSTDSGMAMTATPPPRPNRPSGGSRGHRRASGTKPSRGSTRSLRRGLTRSGRRWLGQVGQTQPHEAAPGGGPDPHPRSASRKRRSGGTDPPRGNRADTGGLPGRPTDGHPE
jgi:hypothetical protein